MTAIVLQPISGEHDGLSGALAASGLPIVDAKAPGRMFFSAVGRDGRKVGCSGVKNCEVDALRRSVVVLADHRGKNSGRMIVLETLKTVPAAAPFFAGLSFQAVDRADVPVAVLSTRQLSCICPASATTMKLNRLSI